MKQPFTKKSTNILILIFLILTLLLCLGGNLLYRYQKKNITIDKHNELSAISKLKVDQLLKWRKDHMDNARTISKNQAVKVHIKEYLQGIHQNENFQIVKEWIYSLVENSEYSLVALIDSAGNTIIATNPRDPISAEGYQSIKQAASGKEIIVSDLFRYNHNKICQDIAIPLYSHPENHEGYLGVVFLRIDPEIFLFSNILKWPIPMKSSEVLIARREGDSVLFLSELQHQKNSAVQLRKPLSNKALLIVQALDGKKGVVEGTDYRGIKVMGDVQPVPGSTWYVVTKVDANEIYNPIVALATWLFIITFLLILISALIIYFVWKKQNEEASIIQQKHLQELVDEQTIDLKGLNLQLQNDIEVRKKIEEKLRESEKRLSFHFENSPLGVVEWDAEYNVTQWSKEAEHIFGWKATETLGKSIGDLNMIYPDDISIVTHTMERLSGSKENVVISSNRNYTKSGEIIEAIWYNTILNDEKGKMISVMSLIEDITERKKTESALRKLSQAVEQSPISIIITDISGKIEYGNQRVNDITGYTPEELLGKKPSLFKSGETSRELYKELWETILSGKEWQGEFHNKKKNGELYWEAASISPIMDTEGKITHLLAIKEDITRRKNDETELLKAKTDLEKRVLERTTELAKSEERFRSTLDNLMEGCMFIGYDLTFLYANDAAAKQLNKLREDLIGQNLKQIYPDRSLISVLKGFQFTLMHRVPNHFIEELRFVDGSLKWFDFRVEPAIEGIFVMSENITERILAEQKIKKSENDLKSAQHIAKLGYYDWENETDKISWSDEMFTIMGIKREMYPDKFEDHKIIYTPESWELANRTLKRTIQFGEPFNMELEFIRHDNREHGWINSIGYVVKDDSGIVKHLMGTAQDITERKEAEKALRESEEGFRLLAESVPHFVWVTEADGMNIYFNERWTEYTGMTMEESYGTGWNKPFHPDDQLMAWNAWNHATETGASYDIQCRLKKFNGEYHWFVIRGAPLFDISGVIIKWYGTCTEIDSQKQLEEEIKKMNEELEQRVNARTLQLQTANKELEAFAYSVSHDLRAPLRSIDGWSMALLEDCYAQLDLQGKEYLERVRNESQRMGFLIDDLLKLSRVSRTEIKKVSVDLSLLADDITKRLMKSPTNRHFEIIIQPGMFTMGDQSMLDIALTNLLDNAYKFTSRQQVARIEFGQSVIDEKQTYWIKDNGVGFDMSYSKNLFGAFQRMHKQSEFPGTGIGLATVQRIIHRHDGNIWVESKKDQGTTFYFTITDETR